MLRCSQLHLDWLILKEIDMGMVYDMCIEQGNDHCEYDIKGDQDDIKQMFG